MLFFSGKTSLSQHRFWEREGPVGVSMDRSQHSFYFLLVVLAMASLGPLLYMHQNWLLQSRNFAEIVNYLSIIREESAEAHLWAEELITGDTGEDIQEVRQHFVDAKDAALKFEMELPVKIPELQFYLIEELSIVDHSHILKDDLLLLEQQATERLNARSVSGAGTESDIFFDAVYSRALERTRALEKVIRNKQAEVTKANVRKHWSTLLVWGLTLFGTLIFVSIIRARQRVAEENTRKLESRFLEAQKLESLGVLAGGIAHDFNNLLQTVSGNTSLLIANEALSEEVKKQLLEIDSGAQKASELTNQMLAYAGKGRLSETVVCFDDAVEEIASLVRLSTSKTVTVDYNLNSQNSSLRCNEMQLQQVMMNLIINAAEASTGDCKRVEVATYCREFSTEEILMNCVGCSDHVKDLSDQFIVFEVSDRGVGMDSETLDRCFEPFFSTKFTGRGLGLAAVLGIVRAHDGFMKVISEKSVGTTFQALFPICHEKPALPRERRSMPPEILGNDRLVLVIDDDEAVRSILSRMLVQCGYQVDTVSDGNQGLKLLEQRASHYHVVILDMEMPDRTGLEVGKEIRARWAGVPLILSSGYGREVIEDDSLFDDFIQKPYNVEVLATSVGRTALPSSKPSEI